jgi:hypothetical protein
VTALDTSIVIAAFAPWHEAHKVARRAMTPEVAVTNCCRSTFGLNALTDLWGSITGCSPGSSAPQGTRLGDSTGGHCDDSQQQSLYRSRRVGRGTGI